MNPGFLKAWMKGFLKHLSETQDPKPQTNIQKSQATNPKPSTLNFQGPLLGKLVKGEDVTIPDGTVVTPQQCVGPGKV